MSGGGERSCRLEEQKVESPVVMMVVGERASWKAFTGGGSSEYIDPDLAVDEREGWVR